MTGYLTTLIPLLAIAVLVALALNLQWGLGGLVNFGLAGFYALGAYVAALLALGGVPTVAAMLAAMAATAAFSAAVSLVSLRLADDHLAIVTLGFAECVRLVLLNEGWLTQGSLGLPGIPRPFAGLVDPSRYEMLFAAFALAAAGLTYWTFQRVAISPFGRALRAVRDDDVVSATLGKHVLWIRLRAFAIGGAAVGLAGALHAFHYTYIDPGQFGPIITATAFMAVIAGGRGSNCGLVVGAAAVMLLVEGSRFLKDLIAGLDASQLAAFRLMLIGLGLVLLLMYRPQGLLAERRSTPQS